MGWAMFFAAATGTSARGTAGRQFGPTSGNAGLPGRLHRVPRGLSSVGCVRPVERVLASQSGAIRVGRNGYRAERSGVVHCGTCAVVPFAGPSRTAGRAGPGGDVQGRADRVRSGARTGRGNRTGAADGLPGLSRQAVCPQGHAAMRAVSPAASGAGDSRRHHLPGPRVRIGVRGRRRIVSTDGPLLARTPAAVDNTVSGLAAAERLASAGGGQRGGADRHGAGRPRKNTPSPRV